MQNAAPFAEDGVEDFVSYRIRKNNIGRYRGTENSQRNRGESASHPLFLWLFSAPLYSNLCFLTV
jgi:hypothetical protein